MVTGMGWRLSVGPIPHGTSRKLIMLHVGDVKLEDVSLDFAFVFGSVTLF